MQNSQGKDKVMQMQEESSPWSDWIVSENSWLLVAEDPWQTKVCYFWHHCSIHQYVFRFKVQMNHTTFLVKKIQTVANSLDDLTSHVPIKDWRFICRN
jgi:hypothetical protein